MKCILSLMIAILLLSGTAMADGIDISKIIDIAGVHTAPQESQTETAVEEVAEQSEASADAAIETVTQALEKTAAVEVKPGAYVTYGSYPQTTKGDDNTPIEWLVLELDGDRVFLMSRYGIDREPYNKTKDYVTWETCSLRAWLNDGFIHKAFTEEEIAGILET